MFYYCKKPSTNAEIMEDEADQRNQPALQGKHGARDRPAGKEAYSAFVDNHYNHRSN